MTLQQQSRYGLWAKLLSFFGWWELFVSLSTIQRKGTALFLYGFYRRRLLHCFKHWFFVLKVSSQSVLAGNNAAVFWDEKFLSQSLKLLSLNEQTLLDQTDAESRSKLRWEKRHFHYFQRQLRVASQTKVKLLTAQHFLGHHCLVTALDSWKFNLAHPCLDPKVVERFILRKYWATWTKLVSVAHRADLALT